MILGDGRAVEDLVRPAGARRRAAERFGDDLLADAGLTLDEDGAEPAAAIARTSARSRVIAGEFPSSSGRPLGVVPLSPPLIPAVAAITRAVMRLAGAAVNARSSFSRTR